MIGWILYRKSENELNITSDHAIIRFIQEAKLQNIELRVHHSSDLSFHLTPGKITFLYQGFTVAAPDFVLARRGANTTPECYQLLHALRASGTMLINTPESIALAQDKLLSGIHLAKHKLPIPNTQSINSTGAIEFCKRNSQFPIILKKPIGKRGMSVMKCSSEESFEDSCGIIGLNNGTLLSQEFITTSYGRDLRVLVLGNEAIACMQRVAKTGGYKSNFSLGGSVTSYPLNENIKQLSEQAAGILGLDIAGVDLLFSEAENTFTICEVNSSPGIKGLELASNLNIAKMIVDYIAKVTQSHKDKSYL